MRRRATKQREYIRDVAKTLYHPTSDEVYDAIAERRTGIGRATVFRNLNVLAEQGVFQKVYFPEEPIRYDTNPAPHSHFVCGHCGTIIDLPEIRIEVPVPEGAEAQGYYVVGYGICEKCKRQGGER